MSNPDHNTPPNLRRDGARHAGPLVGMALVVLFGVGLILYWLAEETASAPDAAPAVDVTAPPGSEGGGSDGGTTAPPAPETVPPAPAD